MIAGDLNSPLPFGSVISKIKNAGYSDTFKDINFFKRGTCPFDILAIFYLNNFDYILINEADLKISILDPTICKEDIFPDCYGASDHYPIWITVKSD